MDVGENAREPALLWRNLVGHSAFPKGSAAMLGQFSRLIQSNETSLQSIQSACPFPREK
jgi:hypothetical protein